MKGGNEFYMKVTAHIKPNSRHRQEVIKHADDTYTICTKAPAIESRANQEAIMLLATYFSVPKSHVVLTRGVTSKYKVFTITQATHK